MKPIRAFVAEDEPLALRRVLRALNGIEGVKVVGNATDGAQAVSAIQALKPDLLLLDVMMPGLTGFELLEALDQDCTPAVIFVTAFDEYAVSAFAEGAVDYLLKPLDDERLATAVERARSRLDQDANRVRFEQLRQTIARMNTDFESSISSTYDTDLWVREADRVLRIRVKDIDWIEAAGDYVVLHTKDAVHLADDSIRSLSERLDPDHFLQVHRSSIVRLDQVEALNREKFSSISLKLKSGARVRVSKTYKRAVLDRFPLP
jgi:DNA-binding LytR/AlgR family response regulator